MVFYHSGTFYATNKVCLCGRWSFVKSQSETVECTEQDSKTTIKLAVFCSKSNIHSFGLDYLNVNTQQHLDEKNKLAKNKAKPCLERMKQPPLHDRCTVTLWKKLKYHCNEYKKYNDIKQNTIVLM